MLLQVTSSKIGWESSSYKIELRRMTSHFQLLTQRQFLQKFFLGVTNSTLFFHFRVTNSMLKNLKLNFELLT